MDYVVERVSRALTNAESIESLRSFFSNLQVANASGKLDQAIEADRLVAQGFAPQGGGVYLNPATGKRVVVGAVVA